MTFIKGQASANYDESFDPGEVSENDFGSGSSTNSGSLEGDPLFEEAKALALETQKLALPCFSVVCRSDLTVLLA